jgi:hypothetical protein
MQPPQRPAENVMTYPTYEERYCAFIDILGFGELIEQLDNGAIALQALRDLLSKVHNPPPANASMLARSDFRAQSISDAVALSAAPNPPGLGAIIHSVSQLAVDLLRQGFLIRGALVKDLLYHDDKTVLGKALLRAYRLESSVVRYPRVMVTREVANDIRSIDEKTYSQLLRRSEDGPMFVHVLRAIEIAALPAKLGTADFRRLRIDNAKFYGKLLPYAGIADQLQRRFDEATDNPNHFEKVKWFANYWNEETKRWDIEGFKRVTGPGLDPKPAVWGP